MFVIADNRHKAAPSYLRKITKDGMGLITVSLSDAIIYQTKSEADRDFKEIKDFGQFSFAIFQLGIIA